MSVLYCRGMTNALTNNQNVQFITRIEITRTKKKQDVGVTWEWRRRSATNNKSGQNGAATEVGIIRKQYEKGISQVEVSIIHSEDIKI